MHIYIVIIMKCCPLGFVFYNPPSRENLAEAGGHLKVKFKEICQREIVADKRWDVEWESEERGGEIRHAGTWKCHSKPCNEREPEQTKNQCLFLVPSQVDTGQNVTFPPPQIWREG